MSYLIEILLPTTRSQSNRAHLAAVRAELAEQFGGVTFRVDTLAEGLWEDDGKVELDRAVVVEVMADDLDRTWWAAYRSDLEARFGQEEIVIRAMPIERL